MTPVYQIKTATSIALPDSEGPKPHEHTEPLTLSEWASFKHTAIKMPEAYVIIWQHHGIFVGKVSEGDFNWLSNPGPIEDLDHCQRMRIFDETQERHFWRSEKMVGNKIKFDWQDRYRGEKDVKQAESPQSGEIRFLDTDMVLRAIVAQPVIKAESHKAISTADKQGGKDLKLKVRQYLEAHPQTGQTYYADHRFVGIAAE